MAVCEMCGRSGNLVVTEVEGVELKVCSECSKYGKVKKSQHFNSNYNSGYKQRFNPSPKKEAVEEIVVSNLNELLHKERERRNLNQEDFAKLLNERESQLSKWESGAAAPNLDTAKKLQRILGITLVKREEAQEEAKEEKQKQRGDVLTLGDFIKVKKRN